MEKTTKQLERWWRVPLLTSPLCKTTSSHGQMRRLSLFSTLLIFVMSFMPQGAQGKYSLVDGTGFFWDYFMKDFTYNANTNTITFTSQYCHQYLASFDEGFYNSNGFTFYARKDGNYTSASGWTKLGTIRIKANTKELEILNTAMGFGMTSDAVKILNEGPTPAADKPYGYNYIRTFKWELPIEWRNCNIHFMAQGTWTDKDGTTDPHTINSRSDGHVRSQKTPYTFTIRKITWNGDLTISPDSTITVPYKLETTARNTDGYTRIWTYTNGNWNNKISAKEIGNNFNPGTYTFNMHNAGLSYRKAFKISLDHEFRHDNDLSNNGKAYTTSFTNDVTFNAFPVATLQSAFLPKEEEGKVIKLTWTADITNYQVGNWGTKWAIYRNGEYCNSILQNENGTAQYTDHTGNLVTYNTYSDGIFTFYDTGFPHEKEVKYEVYYVWKDWNPATAKVSELKSTNYEIVDTELSMPIDNMTVTPSADRIEFAWTSTAHSAGWGNKFNIYMVDKQGTKTLLYTIIPKDQQAAFKWVHRSKDISTRRTIEENPTTGSYPAIYYTEEPLNNCTPHDYIIEGVIEDVVYNSVTLEKRAIGTGTLFESFEATKGSYNGTVKLTWTVDRQGSNVTKDYEIHRCVAGQNTGEWDYLETISSNEDRLRYTDDTALPGVFYNYRITVIDRCEDGQEMTNSITDIGFAQTTGTISGRITFGSAGSSVEGVQVYLQKTSTSGDDVTQYHSLHFTGYDSFVTSAYPSNTYAANKFSNGAFSMQMWIYPEKFSENCIARLYSKTSDNSIGLGMSSSGKLFFCDGNTKHEFDLTLKENQYNHVALTRSGNTLTCYIINNGADGNPVLQKATANLEGALSFGNDTESATQFVLGYVKGFIDEFRLWTKCLSKDQIEENYDHLLVGNEKGLETYWTFDEGLSEQFFDYSREGTVYHQHHGKIGENVESSTTTPNQLALKAKTDIDGNYIIQGIPFSGEGTNFNVIPMLNSHEFSPQKQSRFISGSSLVHNSVDFTDVSSFEVSGTIIYAGTNIPVDSVQIYVDGRAVARNDKAVMTNSEGEFVVDVPIGKHYITAVRDGHTFVNNGRIPEDPTGLNEEMMEFKNPVSGLRFIDNTLVPIAGRVVGGAIEGDKPLGFGLSENNIGKAVITLQIPNTNYMLNAEERMDEDNPLVSTGFWPVATNTDVAAIEGMMRPGVAYRTGGDGENDAKNVVITTDTETGEFGIMLPPLDYKVLSVVMENTEGRKHYQFNPEQLPRINASDATIVLRDSTENKNGEKLFFDYTASFKQTVHTEPKLRVTQNRVEAGAFGESSIEFVHPTTGEKKTVNLFTVGNDNEVTYTFNYPIFKELCTYTFNLEGYENYINYDKTVDGSDYESKVPLKDVVVTIGNALSSTQVVQSIDDPNGNAGKVLNLKENQLVLNDEGRGTYTWKAGLPNIQDPFTRTLNMTYSNGAGEYKWKGNTNEGLSGIIFGDLPSGTNFTTQGPDEVEMILHDPYGDSSFATWETGSVIVQTKDTVTSQSQANNLNTTLHLGPDITTSEGFGVMVELEIDYTDDFSTGFDRTTQTESTNSTTSTVEITKSISTGGDSDFVGADGDIYIGKSTNLLFGRARSVGLKPIGTNDLEVNVDDAIVVGKKFATNFYYTQYEIENVIIPNLITMRNDLLYNVPDKDNYNNTTGHTMYVTSLQETDEHFGEEGTYKCYPVEQGLNMVQFYNDQIASWENAIMENEKYKVETVKAGKDKQNVSFGGGIELTETKTVSTETSSATSYTHNWTYNFQTELGLEINGLGMSVETTTNTTWEGSESLTNDTTVTTTFSYTLADSGANDSFSMDIYPASKGHSPMFKTVAGQTSCPYEGQVLTKYYKKDKEELSAATMKIEDPEIDCNNRMLTGVPTGGQAQFELLLKNNSVTNTDNYFRLIPVDGTNPLGAKLSLPTGPIEDGRTVFVPAGETVKMILTLEQGNIAITKYDDIVLALTSTCQDDIRSEVSISAEFVPSSTPVELKMDKYVVNAGNVSSGVQFTVKGFNRNFAGLQRVDLQYLAPGEHTWSLLKGYIPSESVRADNSQELLPENGVIELSIDMGESMWRDGTYQFRAQSSALYEGKPVTAESDVLTLVKDLNRPQLFGAASPGDGVLNSGDEISVTFNEDIQKERLTKNNIIISGVLNGYELQHDVALSAQNTERAAYTQAGFNLAKKSFSADMWVLVTAAGDIFTHGNGDEKFKLAVDANNKLVASIGGNDYVSANAIEKDTWTFLTFSYDYDEGSSHLNARAVTANDTKDLFDNEAVADYTGSGSITLGQNFKGAIHELTLWDKARTMQEAQAEMNFSKKPSTPNLIGYWKMDEGNGTEIRDYARNRHLTMPANTWYLNNDNKAVTLDGTKTLTLNISACNPMPTDDYAVEMWFKGDKADQSAASTLFAANSNSVGISFNANGGLTMKANGSDTELTSTNVLDNAWHHLALNVLRNGNATAYVDGKAVKTFAASAVPALEGATLYVGSQRGDAGTFFKGLVDEIRIWNASMTGDLLTSQRTQRLKGNESGLAAYYSFEKMTRNPNNGLITSVSNDEDLTGSGLTAEVVTSTSTTPQLPNYTDEAPALKVKPEATNVEYNFVANERGIIITLNETPARLEGTTLQFTVRAVQDLNGNESSTVNWTAFVRQNSLLWKDDSAVTLEKQVGDPASFEATFTNESGTAENWTLSGLPSWLTASATSGTLKAQLSKTITFTIAESVPTGKYEETIYLTGNDNISEPLTLNLKVKAEEPDWVANRSGYSETMNLVGSLQILDVPCRDEDDIVAAFIGTECRGVAHPEYVSRYDAYFVTMDIYGSSDDDEVPLTLKVFEASTGIIYPVVKAYFGGELMTPEFKTDNLLGTFKAPVILNATDEVEQNIDLTLGWNWMSLGVKPGSKPADFTVERVFANADGKVEFVKTFGDLAEYDDGDWLISGLTQMNNREMYAVQANDDLTLSVTGHRVKSNEEPITVKNGWSWVAFNSLSVMSLDEALAGMQPQDDEIIKGQRGVAFYDTYEWVGSLKQLTPGLGYKIQGKLGRTFTYPVKTATSAGARSFTSFDPQLPNSSVFTPVDYHLYPGNMVLVAQLVLDGQPVEGVELGIFAGEECREAAFSDERGLVITTIPGDKPCELTFRVSDGDSQPSTLNAHITYENDAVVGTPKAPFIIDLGEATGIVQLVATESQQTGQVFDMQGRKVELNDQGRKLRKGVYIVNGQKKVK